MTGLASTRHEVADADVQEFFYRRGWTDGLPIVPPTDEAVARCVAASGFAPDHVLASVDEQGRVLTVEKVAINAVMAGCTPDLMPVLVAAVQAMGDDAHNLHTTTISGATAPLIVVSGAIVERLGFNSGFSVFGPGYRPNASIGRAARLILHNLCAGVPGVTDKSTMGHPGKYAYCIAESARWNPWDPVHAQLGVDADASAVTVITGEAPINARNDWSSDPETILATVADAMGVGHFAGGHYLVVLGPLHARSIAARGWTVDGVREFLSERAVRSVGDLRRAGRVPPTDAAEDSEMRRAAPGPDRVLVTVAGGHLYGYSAVVPPWIGGPESMPVARRIEPAAPDATNPQ